MWQIFKHGIFSSDNNRTHMWQIFNHGIFSPVTTIGHHHMCPIFKHDIFSPVTTIGFTSSHVPDIQARYILSSEGQ